MKTSTLILFRMVYLRTIVLLMLVLAVACRKNNTAQMRSHSIQAMADALHGELLKGGITTETDDEGLALWCNGGKVLIAIAKLTSATFTNPGNIDHAQVVRSDFGIIIRDAKSNTTWYYIQNDAQSRRRFEQLQNTGGGQIIVSGMTESIRINIS